MKLSTVFVGALATLAAAAPAKVEEEKRNVGGFGGGLDALALGGVAGLGSVPFFGQANIVGNVFNAGLVNQFNNFAIANQPLAILAATNGFSHQSLFTLFDLSLGVNGLNGIFNLGAGGFLDIGSILQLQSLFTFQWLINSFGNELFFGNANFLGFGGLAFPQLNFGGLAGAGIGLQTQFPVNLDVLDLGLVGGFDAGLGFNAFQQFNFANLGISAGGFLKE